MERRIPRERRKYLKCDSDRTGFTYFKNELTRDDGWLVSSDEVDDPPPTSKYIGSEGDINMGDSRSFTEKKKYPTAKTEIYNP